MTRFDIPHTVTELMLVAMTTRTIDVLDLYALGTRFNNDWFAFASEICEIAHTQRHTNVSAHSKVVSAAEKVWVEFKKGN